MPTLADIHKAKISGDGEKIVLLGHGFGTDQTVWHNLEPLLLRRHYRVMLYNLMGQGTGVPTGFSSTSLGHSAASRVSADSNSSDSPKSLGKKHGTAIERATSDVANEEFERELKALQLSQQGAAGESKRGLFGRKINESFSRLFARSKKKSKDVSEMQHKEEPAEAQPEVSQESANGAASKDPEFSGRRDFKIEDLDREEDERPERIEEEEAEGIVLDEDFNHSRYSSLDAFAEDLINLMDEVGVKQCIYVGHSVSGMIGLLASVRRPDLFQKLVLLTSSPRYLNDGDYIGGFQDTDIDNLLAAIKTNYKAWVQGFAPVAIHAPNNEAVADYAAGLLDVRPDVAYCILSTIFRSDYRHILPQVSVPCHVLVSNNDVAVPLQVSEYMHKHLRGSALEVLSTHGHLPHLSSPMLVNAALIKHIEQPP